MSFGHPIRRRSELTLLGNTEWIALGVLAVVSLLLEHGFFLSDRATYKLGWVDLTLAVVCFVDYVGAFFLSSRKIFYLRRRLVEGGLALLLLTVIGIALHHYFLYSETPDFISYLLNEMKPVIVVVQCYLALNVGVLTLNGFRKFFSIDAPAPLLVISSYLIVIAAGTALLMLPRAVAAGSALLSFQEALFTATSAVTVTGLTIVEIGSRFSVLGQLILLTLIQIGGISIVAIVGLLAYTEGEKLNLRQMKVLRAALGLSDLKDVKQLLSVVLLFTLTLEALGALALFTTVPKGESGWVAHLYWSIFHSISAFCSAGFSLQSDSMAAWGSHPGVNLTIPLLVIAGGIGFPVALDLIRQARRIDVGRILFPRRMRLQRRTPRPPLRLQTRYALYATTILLVGGFLLFWVLEGGMGSWSGNGIGERFWSSVFHTAMIRSCGLTTVDPAGWGLATLVAVMVMMTIGAGPISTGGGMKTVTLAVLIQTLRSFLAGRGEVVAHHRTIPQRTVWAALTVFFFYITMLCFTFFALALVAPEVELRALLFEAVSALGTVGLSLGATQQVGFSGQLFLMVAMVVGKIGPLSLAIGVLAGRERTTLVKYPQEELIVG